MNRFFSLLAVIAFVGLIGVARAADDPTGTWKWSVTFGDKTFDATLKLKLEGDKLTGAYVGRNSETPIENASFKDGQVSFSVTREFQNNKVTTKYQGTLSGDTIKGKSEFERDGQKQSRDWEAKRQK